jgi:phage shock protein PspC (stress-responsive transcriptional regulator)
MKKTISITIGGVLFQIEEDGFDQLRQYLDQVHKYFSTYEDSREILSDIETRIAELFISRHTDRLESITQEDVAAIVATMGSVADFAADEAENDNTGFNNQQQTTGQTSSQNTGQGYARSFGTGTPPPTGNIPPDAEYLDDDKKAPGLRRNLKLKMLGGVCAGLAQYLNISAVWVRLGFLALFFGFGWLPFIPVTILLLYVALWVSMPAVYQDELRTVRKLFRSNKNKAIAGVCGGLAQYFGIDVSVVRLLAIVSFFAFGIGFWVYVVLWAVTPLATTLTDEMKMTGTPINLASIEDTVKRNLQPENGDIENGLTKLILLPFRLIGTVLTGLAPIAGAILRGIGILVGLILLIAILSLMFALFLAVMAATHIIDWTTILHIEDFPVSSIMDSIPTGLITSVSIVAFLPLMMAFLLALRLIFGRPKLPMFATLTLLGLWVLSIGWVTIEALNFAYLFHEESSVERTTTLGTNAKNLQIEMGLSDQDHDWSSVGLEVETTTGDSIVIIRTYESNGKTDEQATALANQIKHKVSLTDSTLYIDGRFELEDKTPYRGQHLKVKVLLPHGTQFTIDKKFTTNLNNIYWEGYDSYRRLHNGVFKFKGDTLWYLDSKSQKRMERQSLQNENGNYYFEDPEQEEETDEDQ